MPGSVLAAGEAQVAKRDVLFSCSLHSGEEGQANHENDMHWKVRRAMREDKTEQEDGHCVCGRGGCMCTCLDMCVEVREQPQVPLLRCLPLSV